MSASDAASGMARGHANMVSNRKEYGMQEAMEALAEWKEQQLRLCILYRKKAVRGERDDVQLVTWLLLGIVSFHFNDSVSDERQYRMREE